MPGLIDAHRHINTGPDEKAQMQALLEAGYTTILSGGGPADGNLTLKDHIDKGVINGPRIIPSGRVGLLAKNTPEMARAEIRALAAMGIKFTGELLLTPVPGPSPQEIEVLRAIVDEGQEGRRDDSGPCRELVGDGGRRRRRRAAAGPPAEQGLGEPGGREKVAASGARILTTSGFGAPVFGVFAERQQPAVP